VIRTAVLIKGKQNGYNLLMFAHESQLADISSVNLEVFAKNTAFLAAVEYGKEIPWSIERVFFITARNSEERGDHAHRQASQAFICINESANLICKDGLETRELKIEALDRVILVPPGIWVNLKLQENATVAVVTNLTYDEKDYINQWDHFLKLKGLA